MKASVRRFPSSTTFVVPADLSDLRCPVCNVPLDVSNCNTVNYDVVYQCPICELSQCFIGGYVSRRNLDCYFKLTAVQRAKVFFFWDCFWEPERFVHSDNEKLEWVVIALMDSNATEV